jgi:hydrogenase maturation protease
MRILERQLLTLDLVEELSQAKTCVLLDAATSGDEGALVERDVAANAKDVGALGHDLSPAALLGLTQQLTGAAPHCVLITTKAINTELGETLSPQVAALVDVAVTRVIALSRGQ